MSARRAACESSMSEHVFASGFHFVVPSWRESIACGAPALWSRVCVCHARHHDPRIPQSWSTSSLARTPRVAKSLIERPTLY
eukprot:2913508-Prymnesium_polylepis.1